MAGKFTSIFVEYLMVAKRMLNKYEGDALVFLVMP